MEFLSKIRNNMQKKVSRMPEGLPSLEEMEQIKAIQGCLKCVWAKCSHV
jgi:hypothetical protein